MTLTRLLLCIALLLGVLSMAVPASRRHARRTARRSHLSTLPSPVSRVYSPWILSEHVADTRDEVRFAADARWATLKGQEKALAVWRYLTDRVTGTWHFSDTSEGADPSWEGRIVKDPVKDLNVYGFGVCTVHACLIEGIYEALGFGTRQMDFGGYHRTAEVEWDGAWHYLDVDERAYLVDPQGRVVSVTDAVSHPELWEPSSKLVSPFYPQNGGVRGISELAKHGPPIAHWHWRTLGHTMDFVLRPGESLTRYWKPQGSWRVDPSWVPGSLKWLSEPPPGPKTGASYSANNSYGNGKWEYRPRLSPRSRDFADGVYRSRNVRLIGTGGLRVATSGSGWAEWRMRSPYIIAGRPNDLSNPNDDSDAAVVSFTASGPVALSVSTDQGRHWTRVWSGASARGPQRVDLTRWVVGRYEYHVRVDLTGRAQINALAITTWTQLAPMSLPRLKAGVNHLSFVWGDRHDAPTEMVALEPELSDPADAARWGVQVEGKYDPSSPTARARGPVTMKVRALEGTKLRWLHIGGAFNASRESGVRRPDRITYAVDPSEGWRLLRQDTPPEWNQHWYYNAEADLVLTQPVEELTVRLDPATAVQGLRVYAHCAPDEAEPRGPVVVTHTYRIGGKTRSKTFRFTHPQGYEIICEGEPENVSVTMAMPSR